MFLKQGKDWQSFPSDCPDPDCLKTVSQQYPHEVVWTIAFAGRILGQVKGQTPDEFSFYSDVGLQKIEGSVPTIGKRSAEYGGFTRSSAYRPLIANSQPYVKDPESWKHSQLSSNLIGLLREQFRKKFPTVLNCANPVENIGKPWLYRNRDIKIITTYSSRNNWSVAQLELVKYRCDGPSEDAFNDQWFAISPAQGVKF